MIIIAVLLLFIVGCNAEQIDATRPYTSLNQELKSEIDRLNIGLKWCDGFAVPSYCDMGDSHYRTGQLFMLGAFSDRKKDAFLSYSQSIDDNGRPWRSPLKNYSSNSYSRDQLLGLTMATLGGLDKAILAKVYDYSKREKKICPDATDSRCLMTLSVETVVRDTLELNVDDYSRIIGDYQLMFSAYYSPLNYQMALVMQSIMIKVKQGKLTTNHAEIAAMVRKRMPANLYAEMLYLMTNQGTGQQFDDLAKRLLQCMRRNLGGGIHALWEQGNVECIDNAYGQELVAMAHYFIQGE